MAVERTELTHQQLTAIELMLSGIPFKQIAERVGVTPTSLYLWRQTDRFTDELDKRRQEVYQEAQLGLEQAAMQAVRVAQRTVAGSEDVTPLQWKAADSVLSGTGLFQRRNAVQVEQVEDKSVTASKERLEGYLQQLAALPSETQDPEDPEE